MFIRPLQSLADVGEAVETGGEVQYFTEQDVGAGDTLIVPEQLNLVETAINIQAEPGDLIIFVVSTNNFPDEGQLLIGGREVVNYSSKLEDRFIIDPGNRGQLGTDAEQWLVGTIVQPFVENLSINVGRIELVENEFDISTDYSVISESTTLATVNEESEGGDVNVLSVTEEDILSRFVESDINNTGIDVETNVLRFVSEESVETLIDQPVTFVEQFIFGESESSETIDVSQLETDVLKSVYPAVIDSDIQATSNSIKLVLQSDSDSIVGLVGIAESSFTLLSDPEEEVIDVALAFVGMESISDQITLDDIESTAEFNIVDTTSSTTLFNEIDADVTILTVQTSTDYVDVTPVVEAEPLDVSLVDTGIESISDEIVLLPQINAGDVSLSAAEINADITLLVSSEDTEVGVETIQSISDVTEVEQVVETPSDVSLINAALLGLEGQITLAPVDSQSAFTSFTAVATQIVNNILEVGEYSVEIVGSESEATTIVDETAEEEEISDVSLIVVGLEISDEVISITEPEFIALGESVGTSQEILKVPEDIGLSSSAEAAALLNTSTQIDSIVDTDEREVSAPEHQDTQIDTTIDNGAIDEFIEIDTIQIDLN